MYYLSLQNLADRVVCFLATSFQRFKVSPELSPFWVVQRPSDWTLIIELRLIPSSKRYILSISLDPTHQQLSLTMETIDSNSEDTTQKRKRRPKSYQGCT